MEPSLLDRLRGADYRLTSQRRAVAEVLDGQNVHLTAEEVHEQAKLILPEISRATAYSTLRELAQMGEVLEVTLDGGPTRYDPNVSPAHHHLFCESCGSVFDVQHDTVAPPPTKHDSAGFTIRRSDIVHRGTCSACSETPAV